MSEEKIIEEFKELIYNPDYDEILLCTEDGFTGWHELFKNVLDLYQKEKEKNKKLNEEREYIKNNLRVDLNRKGVLAQAKGQIKQILDYYENNDKYLENY